MVRGNVQVDAAPATAVRRAWRAWYGTLANVASKPSRKRSLAEIYSRHHDQLMVEVARHVDSSDETLAGICREIEVLVAPWIAIDSFTEARIEIRRDLVRRCAELDARFGGGGGFHWPQGRRVAGGVLTAGCVLAAATVVADVTNASLMFANLRYEIYRIGVALDSTSTSGRIMAGSLVMFLFGWWILHSMKRS